MIRFTTYDVYMVAYLQLVTGRTPEMDLNDRGIVVFSYEEDDQLLTVMNAYKDVATTVPMKEYVDSIKHLKGHIFKMKDEHRRIVAKG